MVEKPWKDFFLDSGELIEEAIRQNPTRSYSDIAREYGVSRQWVSQKARMMCQPPRKNNSFCVECGKLVKRTITYSGRNYDKFGLCPECYKAKRNGRKR